MEWTSVGEKVEDSNLSPSSSSAKKEKNVGEFSQSIENREQKFSIESSSQQKALSNPLIIRKILLYSSPQDVLNFRLISKAIEEEATSLILSDSNLSKKFRVKFSWAGAKTNFQYEHVYLGSLQDFTEDCLIKSRRFPTWNFYFVSGDLGSSDALRFFNEQGKNIKGLTILPKKKTTEVGANVSMTSSQTLRSVLYDWLPNLKHLTFVATTWPLQHKLFKSEEVELKSGENPEQKSELETKTEPKAGESPLKIKIVEERNSLLPSLESLTLLGGENNCSNGIIADILNSAPNLKLVNDVQFKYTEVLCSAEKFLLSSKTIDWKFETNEIINRRFTRYAEAGPEVREISLKFWLVSRNNRWWPEISRGLEALFYSSQSTLEKINVIPFLQCLPSIELPVMEKVTLIHCYQFSSQLTIGRELFLPFGYTLSKSFPNLKTIGFHRLQYFHESPESNPFFNNDYFHEKVTSLEVNANHPQAVQPDWIENCIHIFPSVTHFMIQIQSLDALPGICKAIFKFYPLVESLNFYLNYPTNKIGNELPGEMDSAVTGFPLEICKQLRRTLMKTPQLESEVEDVDNLRENPSILNLKKLQTFKIESWTFQNQFEELFTPVSILYGFRPMWQRQKTRVLIKSKTNVSYDVVKGVCGVKRVNAEWLIVG